MPTGFHPQTAAWQAVSALILPTPLSSPSVEAGTQTSSARLSQRSGCVIVKTLHYTRAKRAATFSGGIITSRHQAERTAHAHSPHAHFHHRLWPRRHLLRIRNPAARLVREIVLIGDTETHVQGEAIELQQASPPWLTDKNLRRAYKDAAESSIVIVTVGSPGKLQGSRLDMLAGNVVIVRSCITKLMAEGFNGVVIIATNPVDVLTYIVQKKPAAVLGQVIGSGTLLDTERLRHILGEQLNVDPRSVHAAVIGEHRRLVRRRLELSPGRGASSRPLPRRERPSVS